MTISSTFNFAVFINCSPKNRERKGWTQSNFEFSFKYPFAFKKTVKYYGERKQTGHSKGTMERVTLDVFDSQPRLLPSDNDRLIETIYNLPFMVLVIYHNTEFGAKRTVEMREFFEKEEQKSLDNP